MSIRSLNPATEEIEEEFEEFSNDQIESALARAGAAFDFHSKLPFSKRSQHMSRAADLLEGEKEELGQLVTREMGKTLSSAISEIEKCAWVCRYYAEHAEAFM